MKKLKKDKIKVVLLLILILGIVLGVVYNQYTKILTNRAAERKLKCHGGAVCRISRCSSGETEVGECGPYKMPNGSTDYGVCCSSR